MSWDYLRHFFFQKEAVTIWNILTHFFTFTGGMAAGVRSCAFCKPENRKMNGWITGTGGMKIEISDCGKALRCHVIGSGIGCE